MTTRGDVVDCLLRGRKTERVGLDENPWPETLAAWVQEGYPTRAVRKQGGESRWTPDGRSVPVETTGDYPDPVPAWQGLGLDLFDVGPLMDWMPLRGHSEIVAETDEWVTRRNGAGATTRWWKHKMGTPEHIDAHMTTRAVWEECYRPHLLELDPERLPLAKIRRNTLELAGTGVWAGYRQTFIWEGMRWSMGDVAMYEALALDPEWIHDYARVYTDFYKRHLAYAFRELGLPRGYWVTDDLGTRNGLAVSPAMLRELVFPYYKELVDFLHGYDLPVVFHCCGSVAEALPLIVEAGFDGLNPIERKAAGNDPFAFAERYGDRLAFIGGLDARVFETNDPGIIRREVGAYIDGMKSRGARLIFASDHSLSPRVRYGSYLLAQQVYREHMLY